MRYRKKKNIIDFYDVSIIMPFYKRYKYFKRSLPINAPYFQRNGIEIIIVLDCPSEQKELLEFIMSYPFINFKIIINRKVHEWRNPCKVINVGIKHATFKYILVLDPEIELITDIVYQLRYVIKSYPNSFATGVVAFVDEMDDVSKLQSTAWLSYGSIMVEKKELIAIKGYNEFFLDWGGEDDQIRRRLNLHGLERREILDAKTLHRDKNSDGHKERSSRMKTMPIKLLKDILYPKKVVLNNDNWGKDFEECLYDWKNGREYAQLFNYSKQFQKFSISDLKPLDIDYQMIILIQVRNEEDNISEVLAHIGDYCDGIIVLDDGSTDNTYANINHDKLLVKVRKNYKGYFDDLENRNILLRLASFFKSDWLMFIDADERIDSRFSDIRKYASNEKIDVYRLHLVDVWDMPKTYRTDMLDRPKNGIAIRTRMFRSKGNLQINANREIHFIPVPYLRNVGLAKILLLHYGNYNKDIRERKFNLYTSQDLDCKKLGHSYDYLKDSNAKLKRIEDIGVNEIKEII